MLVSDFDFDLPEGLIAQAPPAVRGSSRMLVVERGSGTVADDVFGRLPEFLRAGDLLILNDSRVMPARLFATRAGLRTQAGSPLPGGRIEVLLTGRPETGRPQRVGPETVQPETVQLETWRPEKGQLETGRLEDDLWTALVRPGRKVQVGETLLFAGEDGAAVLSAEVVGAGEFGERTLRFAADAEFVEKLDRIGHMPLPPYIHRADSGEDRSRYQTVYAAARGSAAAPTAGLHFTGEILERLRARGVQVEFVTLHVGLGTFQPVRVKRVEEIRLHRERYTLPGATATALCAARAEGRRVIAAGTTTTRTLEHCAAIGRLEAHSGSTEIFIYPGYEFRVVSGLLTNFHLPESTLLMLVSAFLDGRGRGREAALAAYRHAVAERYRFFSYGDCMLIL